MTYDTISPLSMDPALNAHVVKSSERDKHEVFGLGTECWCLPQLLCRWCAEAGCSGCAGVTGKIVVHRDPS